MTLSRRDFVVTTLGPRLRRAPHAPDEYYVIESTKPEVTGMIGATRSFVDYLYALA